MNFARLSPRSLHTVIAYRKIQMFSVSSASWIENAISYSFHQKSKIVKKVDFLAFSTVCIFLAPIHRIH